MDKVSVGKVATRTIQQDGKNERKNLGVDFVVQKSGGEIEYYQVALYALEPETLKRELFSLEAIEDNYQKFLLSMDDGSSENKEIKRLNVLYWLMAVEYNA